MMGGGKAGLVVLDYFITPIEQAESFTRRLYNDDDGGDDDDDDDRWLRAHLSLVTFLALVSVVVYFLG